MCNVCLDKRLGRRNFVIGGASLLAAASFGGTAAAQPVSAASTSDEALKLLMDGNARYVGNQPRERDFSAARASRATGQAPFASILGCADLAGRTRTGIRPESRRLVRRPRGRQFRHAGRTGKSGIWRAAVLGSKLIMVLGHTSCGAVNATVDALQKGNKLPGHIADLVRAMKPGIEPVLKKGGDDLKQRAVITNVQHNVQRPEDGKQPILAGMIAKKQVRVVGGVYDIATGKVTLADGTLPAITA